MSASPESETIAGSPAGRARGSARRWLLAFAVIGLLGLSAAAPLRAQIPFVTDDAEVTPKGRWTIQFFNEYATLPQSAYPDLWQDTSNFVFQYGLLCNLELNIDFPIIAINRGPHPTLGDAFGFGDIDFAAKYKLVEEDPSGLRPAVTFTAAIEIPSGNRKTQLGSGYTDFVLNSIAQKQLSEIVVLHLNLGFQSNGNTLTGAIGIRTPGKILSEGASVAVQVSPALLVGVDLNGAQIWASHADDRQLQLTLGSVYTLNEKLSLNVAGLTGWYSAPKAGVLVGLSYTP